MHTSQLLSQQIRQAVIDSGISLYRLGLDAGVGADVLRRFMRGGDCRISTVDKLAHVLSLELKPVAPKKRTKYIRSKK